MGQVCFNVLHKEKPNLKKINVGWKGKKKQLRHFLLGFCFSLSGVIFTLGVNTILAIPNLYKFGYILLLLKKYILFLICFASLHFETNNFFFSLIELCVDFCFAERTVVFISTILRYI